MKIYKLKLLLIIMFLNSTLMIKAQSLNCASEIDTTEISTNFSGCNLIDNCLPIIDYIPGSTDCTIVVRLNFYFLLPSASSGKFINVTQGDAQQITDWITEIWDSLYLPQLRVYPLPTYIKSPKIKFILNKFEKPVDNTAYSSLGTSRFTHLKSYDDISGINIFFTGPSSGPVGYAEADFYKRRIRVNHNPNTPYWIGIIEAGLLSHELGHCFGLPHTDFIINPTSMLLKNDTCIATDYYIEDSLVWGVNNGCNNADSTASNNFMGSQFGCQRYLSPNQIGVCRYFLLNNLDLSSSVANLTSFPELLVNHTFDTIINSAITWNYNRNLKGDLIIRTGGELVINCDQTFRGNSKLIIEPGGKLIVNGKTLMSYSALTWDGIEVWGNSWLDQDSVNQGYCYINHINNSTIRNARVGITTGRRLSNGYVDPTTTGGIIKVVRCIFRNNGMDIDFQPYVRKPLTKAAIFIGNKSVIRDSYFYDYQTLSGINKSISINLRGVYGVTFINIDLTSDIFELSKGNYVLFGIKAFDSHFVVKGSANFFRKFSHGVLVQNPTNNWPVIIDRAVFLQNYYNSIILYNTIGSRLTNCTSNMINNNQPYYPNTAFYLFESTNYKVENNTFNGNSHTNQVGMYVKNSGPYSNMVYNNTFNNLQQGVFAVGHNWNPLMGIGLKMNCNIFNNGLYNIGVVDHPNAPYGTDWTGIAKSQGKKDQQITDNVRNTYSVLNCDEGAENKFYIEANNNNPYNWFYVEEHGSFMDNAFQPIPQTYGSCSNANELVNLIGSNAPLNRPDYCPNTALPLLSKTELYQQIEIYIDTIDVLEESITMLMDKGIKNDLLDLINDPYADEVALRDTLLSAGPYLSKDVLNAYFSRADVPHSYLNVIHNQNAPVGPIEWNILINLDISDFILDSMISAQGRNFLSEGNNLITSKIFYSQKLEELYFQKLDMFMNDSIASDIDSLISFLNEEKIPNSDLYLADVYFTHGESHDAYNIMNDIYMKGGQFEQYALLKFLLWELYYYPEHIEYYQTDNELMSSVINQASSGSYLTEGTARGVLNLIWGINWQEEKPVPSAGGGGARKNSTQQDKKLKKKTDGFSLYPNPSNNVLNIELENINGGEVSIINVNGQLMLKEKLDSSFGSINISSLPSGVYIVSLINKRNFVSAKKIVVIK